MSTTSNVNGKSMRTIETVRKLTVIALVIVSAMLFTAQALAQPASPAETRSLS